MKSIFKSLSKSSKKSATRMPISNIENSESDMKAAQSSTLSHISRNESELESISSQNRSGSAANSSNGSSDGTESTNRHSPVSLDDVGNSAFNELLEGNITLTIDVEHLSKQIKINVPRKTPLMDILVTVANKCSFNPSSYYLCFPNSDLTRDYKPSTPIGIVDVNYVKVMSKYSSMSSFRSMSSLYMRQSSMNDRALPFDPTVRIVVYLPGNQMSVLRRLPSISLSEIRQFVCEDKSLNEQNYLMVAPFRPGQTPTVLDLQKSPEDYGLKQFILLPLKSYDHISKQFTTSSVEQLSPSYRFPDQLKTKRSYSRITIYGVGRYYKNKPAPPPPTQSNLRSVSSKSEQNLSTIGHQKNKETNTLSQSRASGYNSNLHLNHIIKANEDSNDSSLDSNQINETNVEEVITSQPNHHRRQNSGSDSSGYHDMLSNTGTETPASSPAPPVSLCSSPVDGFHSDQKSFPPNLVSDHKSFPMPAKRVTKSKSSAPIPPTSLSIKQTKEQVSTSSVSDRQFANVSKKRRAPVPPVRNSLIIAGSPDSTQPSTTDDVIDSPTDGANHDICDKILSKENDDTQQTNSIPLQESPSSTQSVTDVETKITQTSPSVQTPQNQSLHYDEYTADNTQIKVPEVKVPEEKVPEEKVPEVKVPEDKVLEEKVLEDKAPEEKILKGNAPKDSKDKVSKDKVPEKISKGKVVEETISEDKITEDRIFENKDLQERVPEAKIPDCVTKMESTSNCSTSLNNRPTQAQTLVNDGNDSKLVGSTAIARGGSKLRPTLSFSEKPVEVSEMGLDISPVEGKILQNLLSNIHASRKKFIQLSDEHKPIQVSKAVPVCSVESNIDCSTVTSDQPPVSNESPVSVNTAVSQAESTDLNCSVSESSSNTDTSTSSTMYRSNGVKSNGIVTIRQWKSSDNTESFPKDQTNHYDSPKSISSLKASTLSRDLQTEVEMTLNKFNDVLDNSLQECDDSDYNSGTNRSNKSVDNAKILSVNDVTKEKGDLLSNGSEKDKATPTFVYATTRETNSARTKPSLNDNTFQQTTRSDKFGAHSQPSTPNGTMRSSKSKSVMTASDDKRTPSQTPGRLVNFRIGSFKKELNIYEDQTPSTDSVIRPVVSITLNKTKYLPVNGNKINIPEEKVKPISTNNDASSTPKSNSITAKPSLNESSSVFSTYSGPSTSSTPVLATSASVDIFSSQKLPKNNSNKVPPAMSFLEELKSRTQNNRKKLEQRLNDESANTVINGAQKAEPNDNAKANGKRTIHLVRQKSVDTDVDPNNNDSVQTSSSPGGMKTPSIQKPDSLSGSSANSTPPPPPPPPPSYSFQSSQKPKSTPAMNRSILSNVDSQVNSNLYSPRGWKSVKSDTNWQIGLRPTLRSAVSVETTKPGGRQSNSLGKHMSTKPIMDPREAFLEDIKKFNKESRLKRVSHTEPFRLEIKN